MKLKKNELLEALTKVKPGLAKKELVEQATHFIFAEDEIVTFNDMISIMHPFKCDVEFSVKGEEFYKIISGVSDNELDLSVKDNTLYIKAKGTKANLSTIIEDNAKVVHLISKMKETTSAPSFWKKLPKEFINGLYLCAFSASKDLATGVRACVAISNSQVYSTDGLRASIYAMDSDMSSMLIPAKDAMELAKYDVVEYGISENWIHFRTKDKIIFNCKSMKGEYPFDKIDALFDEVDEDISFPEGLREVVSGVLIMAEGDIDINKMISVTVKDNLIVCEASKDRGSIEKSIECKYTGSPIKFNINPIFFGQILQHASGLALLDGKAMFMSENFWHIIALPANN